MAKNKSKGNSQSSISFRDSIKTKLIFIMALLVAVPLLVAILISYQSSTSKAKEDALENLDSKCRLVETQFQQIVTKNILALQTFSVAPSTITYIENYGTEENPIPDDVMLAQMDAINEFMADDNNSVILSKASGEQLLRADRSELANISDRDYFQEATSTGKPAISNVVISKSNGNRITIICVPIFNEAGTQVIGTIQRSFDLNNLHEFLAENVSDGYITDRAGMMVAHAQFEITPEDEYDLSDYEFIGSSETDGLMTAVFDGELTYMSWTREPTTGYVVVVSKQNSEIMGSAIKSALIVVIIGSILLVIAIVISLIIATSFTKPIIAVTETITELADGGFKKIKGYSKRKDEFGEIVRSTNSVIDRLSNIVHSIKVSAATVTTSSDLRS